MFEYCVWSCEEELCRDGANSTKDSKPETNSVSIVMDDGDYDIKKYVLTMVCSFYHGKGFSVDRQWI